MIPGDESPGWIKPAPWREPAASMDDSNKPSLLERLSALLMREPEDREQLLKLLHSAFERNLLDGDALSMIEGALQVSEMQVRDIMVPRAQVDMIDVNETPDKFIPHVIATAHSRFPVIDKNRDDVIGVLLADRKSTRLNSSHITISYAVFC